MRREIPRWAWVAMFAPFAVLAVLHFRNLPSIYAGDYAQYLLHAEALAEGRPYADIGYLYTPRAALIGPRVQPPVWPVILAPLVALFGMNLVAAKVVVLAFVAAFFVFVYKRLAASDDPWLAVVAIGGGGVALETAFATNSPLSDLPFCALLWGVVLLADRPGPEPLSWRRTVAIGVVTVLAIGTRIAGVALVPAIFLTALTRPKDRRPLLALSATFALAGLVAVLIVGWEQIPFAQQLFRAPGILLARMASFDQKYRLSFFEATLYPFPWDLANDAYHAATFLLAPLGVIDFFRRTGRSLLGMLVVSYFLMVLLSPVGVQRYLWPVWPLLFYWVLTGGRLILSGIRPLRPHASRVAVLLGAVITVAALARSSNDPAQPTLLGQRDAQELFSWIRTARDSSEVRSVFFAPRVLTMETGAPAMGYYIGPDSVRLAEYARSRITHVIIGDAGLGHPALASMDSMTRRNASQLRLAHDNATFRIFRFHRDSAE